MDPETTPAQTPKLSPKIQPKNSAPTEKAIRVTPSRKTMILAILLAVMAVGCRMDISVSIQLQPDGTGQVGVEILLDPALTEALPPGSDLLLLDDAQEAGWEITGPLTTQDGGTQITMTKATGNLEELANALATIGPPLILESVERRPDSPGGLLSEIVNSFSLRAGLIDGDSAEGFGVFSDPALNSVIGGIPFEEELAAAGATPARTMGLVVRIDAPGQVSSHNGQLLGADRQRSVVEWVIPLDGAVTHIAMTTVQRPDGAPWAGGMSRVLLMILGIWVVISLAFISWVLFARRRRARARELRMRPRASP
jgi:hypothetical protein